MIDPERLPPADELPRLQIDDKHSILYDPNKNDEPIAVYCNDELQMFWLDYASFEWVKTLFLFALERSNPKDIENG